MAAMNRRRVAIGGRQSCGACSTKRTRSWTSIGETFECLSEAIAEADQLIAACVESGSFAADRPPATVRRLLWATIHGAAVIRLRNRLPANIDFDAFASETLDAALAGCRIPRRVQWALQGFHRPGREPSARPTDNPKTYAAVVSADCNAVRCRSTCSNASVDGTALRSAPRSARAWRCRSNW